MYARTPPKNCFVYLKYPGKLLEQVQKKSQESLDFLNFESVQTLSTVRGQKVLTKCNQKVPCVA